jgi:hypothetical protein
LKPCANRGVSMVAGGLPSGMLKFQVARSIMSIILYAGNVAATVALEPMLLSCVNWVC